MRVSKKSLELNQSAELLAPLRGPWAMPKGSLRGLTQRADEGQGIPYPIFP